MFNSTSFVMEKGNVVRLANNWKILQVLGGTVCCASHGIDGECQWVSTEIIKASGEFVETKSGTVYRLPKRSMKEGEWLSILILKKPDEYKALVAAGVL